MSPALEPVAFTADEAGEFDPGASQGLISVFAESVFVFDITATDTDGNSLTGQIEISTG